MDQFLLITTPEWVEVPNFREVIQFVASADAVQAWISGEDWGALNQFGEDTGILPAGNTIVNARLFATGDEAAPLRFWMVLQPS
jgi:hypothetical protein